MNHAPTVMRIRPPQRLTVGAPALSESTVRWWAAPTISASPNIKITIMSAAMPNEMNAAEAPPAMRDCPARPARIGPVQPNPAAR